MRLHSVLNESKVNGPGRRAVVWVQGCHRNCKGCFNQSARPFDGGFESSPLEIIGGLSCENLDGITVSGGEPFEQSSELKELLLLAKEKGLSTFVYTGYRYEELLEKHRETLEACDFLIDGIYMKDFPSKCRWAGSGNQRFLHLEKGLVKEDLTRREEYSQPQGMQSAEIIIDDRGNITMTGFIEDETDGLK